MDHNFEMQHWRTDAIAETAPPAPNHLPPIGKKARPNMLVIPPFVPPPMTPTPVVLMRELEAQFFKPELAPRPRRMRKIWDDMTDLPPTPPSYLARREAYSKGIAPSIRRAGPGGPKAVACGGSFGGCRAFNGLSVAVAADRLRPSAVQARTRTSEFCNQPNVDERWERKAGEAAVDASRLSRRHPLEPRAATATEAPDCAGQDKPRDTVEDMLSLWRASVRAPEENPIARRGDCPSLQQPDEPDAVVVHVPPSPWTSGAVDDSRPSRDHRDSAVCAVDLSQITDLLWSWCSGSAQPFSSSSSSKVRPVGDLEAGKALPVKPSRLPAPIWLEEPEEPEASAVLERRFLSLPRHSAAMPPPLSVKPQEPVAPVSWESLMASSQQGCYCTPETSVVTERKAPVSTEGVCKRLKPSPLSVLALHAPASSSPSALSDISSDEPILPVATPPLVHLPEGIPCALNAFDGCSRWY
eukprot:TRINITY_DN43243_c0_g1_i1.p1 TRINITY_DN43243_c0_g1~~TRINITY_DN43243_c0_g1_i1.p1  ORF type:complete len:469 (-),score=-26.93 TRINITY_DN43243_c0_g1_i1:88-1494(-)